MPYLHLVFSLPFTYFFPLSFSQPPHYHLDTTSLPLNYYPVLSPYSPSLVLGEGPPVNKYSSIVSTCSRVFYFFSLSISPESYSGIALLSVQPLACSRQAFPCLYTLHPPLSTSSFHRYPVIRVNP